ncbi:MAG: rhomboid family intramembrane serine protease [Clostridiales bacterium]|jgi:membrane associated rhomboid family serine protease|nr:rhomboid family intramembrane serine protease [Clostridiales bacterium]
MEKESADKKESRVLKILILGVKRIHYNSPVILTYAAISLVLLLLGYISGGVITEFLVLRPEFGVLNLLRMFTYAFGHADFTHFFANFSIILLIGPLIEEKHGSKKLLLMMIVTAFITAIIHIIFFNTGLLGASGIVFMLILLTPFTNTKTGKIPLTLILIALIYIGREVFLGITVEDNVSRFAHIFGGILGACMGYFIKEKGVKTI